MPPLPCLALPCLALSCLACLPGGGLPSHRPQRLIAPAGCPLAAGASGALPVAVAGRPRESERAGARAPAAFTELRGSASGEGDRREERDWGAGVGMGAPWAWISSTDRESPSKKAPRKNVKKKNPKPGRARGALDQPSPKAACSVRACVSVCVCVCVKGIPACRLELGGSVRRALEARRGPQSWLSRRRGFSRGWHRWRRLGGSV